MHTWHGVEILTPPADFLIDHDSHVEPAPPREDKGPIPGPEVVSHL